MAETWTLHPQLERDTASIGDLPLSHVLIINDANYPGCCWFHGGRVSSS